MLVSMIGLPSLAKFGRFQNLEATVEWERSVMDALAEMLDTKLRTWKPETADQVRARVSEVIELADDDVLDVMRARTREQEVLDLLDESRRN